METWKKFLCIMKKTVILALTGIVMFLSCGQGRGKKVVSGVAGAVEAVGGGLAEAAGGVAGAAAKVLPKAFSIDDVIIEKQLLYDQHTLADTFPYQKGTRMFRFDKMRRLLFTLDSIQQTPSRWALLQNRRNIHGLAPLTKSHHKDEYNSDADDYGVQRRQSIPLYVPGETTPERYGRDGSLVKLLGVNSDSTYFRVESFNAPGIWEVPMRYINPIGTHYFGKAVMVDRANQVIATLEKSEGKWLVRSMNPCTTGAHQPPHAFVTPIGMFVIQDKVSKMLYDNGGPTIEGFAPWASRFTNGAYLHGVPVNNPAGSIVEFSSTLGTIPRSHECVRNASSHAKFIYDWAPANQSVVFVYD